MMRFPSILKAALCAWLAVGAQATVAKPSPKKHIVLIGGRESHAPGEHAHPNGIRVLKALIETSPNLRGVTVDAYPEGWPEDPAALERAATIIWYFDGLARHPLNNAARREQFGRLMKKGVGLVTLHQSSTLSPDDTAIPLPAWLGAARYGMFNRTDEVATLTPARHPTMQGVHPFRYKDEFYPTLRFDTGHGRSVPVLSGPLGIQFQAGRTVTIAPETRTVAWAYERNAGGRAFLFTGVHYLRAFDEPDIRRMLLNAIIWTAGMPVPKGGVQSLMPDQAMGADRQSPQAAQGPEIRTDDVTRFYTLYDATGGKPSAEQLQHDYLDKGSAGLVEFAKLRNFTGARMATAIASNSAMFDDARRCTAVLPRAKTRLAPALAKLATLYPKGIYPPVTLAIGRGKTGGTANASGVMIGLETLCAFDFMEPDPEDRFVYVIAHEYAHVQQPAAQVEDPEASVLTAALIEGAAEFVGELISGSVSYRHLAAAAKGREAELETAFLADKDKKALGSDWLYNGRGTPERPGDLGYWVGYRIAKAYYRKTKDKRAALSGIIEMDDPKAFLAASGWKPGMKLD